MNCTKIFSCLNLVSTTYFFFESRFVLDRRQINAMGKKRKRDVDSSVFKPKRDNAYCTVKTSLKSILRDDDQKEVIQHIVFRCNDIVTEAYQFIRLYCLHLFHNQQPLPTLDEVYPILHQSSREKRRAGEETLRWRSAIKVGCILHQPFQDCSRS